MSYDIAYMQKLKKKWYKWTYKTERESWMLKTDGYLWGGGEGGRINWAIRIDIDTLLYIIIYSI